jgi:hypothetical protein
LAARHRKATSSGARPRRSERHKRCSGHFLQGEEQQDVEGRRQHAESLTLRLKKAETAVEVATTSLKSIRTLVERQGGDVANQAQQSHSDHLLEDLKKLNKQQAAVRKMLDKP